MRLARRAVARGGERRGATYTCDIVVHACRVKRILRFYTRALCVFRGLGGVSGRGRESVSGRECARLHAFLFCMHAKFVSY